jgi:recombination protein RecA
MVQKSGAWFTYEGTQLGQGKENAREFLAEHSEVAEEIDRRVREAVGLSGFDASDDVPVEIPDLETPEETAGSRKSKSKDPEPAQAE